MQQTDYQNLNRSERKAYNFQKVEPLLASKGFENVFLLDDKQSTDFIAKHKDGLTTLKVKFKTRLWFEKKYLKEDLYLCFPNDGNWYLYNHKDLLNEMLNRGKLIGTKSWDARGLYHFPYLSIEMTEILEKYRLSK